MSIVQSSSECRDAPAGPGAADLAVLLRRSGTGDEKAFAELFDATAPRAYGVALRVLANVPRAERVLEDAYREVWLQGARIDPGATDVLTWILLLVHRDAVRVHRATRPPSATPAVRSGRQVRG